MKHWRVAYHTEDPRGTADFTRDVVADSGQHAINQVGWLLVDKYPDALKTYELWSLNPIQRADTQIER